MFTLKRTCRRRGVATVEYALFLAMVAGGVILAADGVSYAMRSSLDETALAMQTEFTARHLPVEDMQPDVDIVATFIAPGNSSDVQAWQFATVAGSLFCGALVWYGLYCQRTTVRIDRAHELTEQLNDIPPELNHDDLFAKRQQILRILSTDIVALVECRLEARHLMSRRLKTVDLGTPREELRQQMESHKLRHLLVCDTNGKLKGVVSDRDLARPGSTAEQLMTRDPITVEPHVLVNPAITLLINKRISCLPVISNGIPIGVLTSTDLMMALQCAMQLLQKVAADTQQGTSSRSQTISAAANN